MPNFTAEKALEPIGIRPYETSYGAATIYRAEGGVVPQWCLPCGGPPLNTPFVKTCCSWRGCTVKFCNMVE